MKELKKQYKIPSKKKFDHPYHEVANVAEHIEMLANHGDRVVYAWPEKNEVVEITYADFAQMVKDLTMGLAEIYGQGAGKKITIIGDINVLVDSAVEKVTADVPREHLEIFYEVLEKMNGNINGLLDNQAE